MNTETDCTILKLRRFLNSFPSIQHHPPTSQQRAVWRGKVTYGSLTMHKLKTKVRANFGF